MVSLTLNSLSLAVCVHYDMFNRIRDVFKWGLAAAMFLLPSGSEEREVLGVWSIPVAILPSCQDMKNIQYNSET